MASGRWHVSRAFVPVALAPAVAATAPTLCQTTLYVQLIEVVNDHRERSTHVPEATLETGIVTELQVAQKTASTGREATRNMEVERLNKIEQILEEWPALLVAQSTSEGGKGGHQKQERRPPGSPLSQPPLPSLYSCVSYALFIAGTDMTLQVDPIQPDVAIGARHWGIGVGRDYDSEPFWALGAPRWGYLYARDCFSRGVGSLFGFGPGFLLALFIPKEASERARACDEIRAAGGEGLNGQAHHGSFNNSQLAGWSVAIVLF
ncbi:hypothetical protein BDK51DRAFT_30252 [Blyttiomyces helicus]|uniref:Uncharacterized protein n=1 Tax=Blyttiomyces helicus TaxID=388810 RepID=A0A4P9WKG6_9FUNG|nr:hypothetical protein BDK51DRAFT_30252 [Blyttiomyces helicus]|eukprot:RKO93471.1 hypothetical protein BDK51DRAFT_30252 [Blyttiomyces helicus]